MADALDILTLGEGVYAAIGLDSGKEDRVEPFITAMSRRVDKLCGPVVKRSVTEYHDGGTNEIYPRETPVDSVTTLKEWDGTAVTTLTAESFGTAASGDQYLLDQKDYPHDCVIYRRATGADAAFTAGKRSVELVYSAGRYDDTASVDERFTVAAQAILRRLWDRETGAWARAADPFEEGLATTSRFFNAVDHVVKEQLHDQMKPPGTG